MASQPPQSSTQGKQASYFSGNFSAREGSKSELGRNWETFDSPTRNSYGGALTNSWDHLESYLTSGRTSNVLHLDTADANELEIYLNRIGTKLSVQDEQVLDKFYSAFPVSNKQFNTRVHATAKDLELLLKWKDANAVTHGVFRNFFTQRLPEGEFLRRCGTPTVSDCRQLGGGDECGEAALLGDGPEKSRWIND
ncbi:hypothetical protein PSTG_07453 [Puccinia striiformis f. sp. tritici PST-78]|uniref:Uncharacterized protein n=1 Tax=Puccinia striiformis f. sp. tritici PST-78 TaxID=1165861 RepID=A0A0L0VJE7_9BASI|nr:hypothetical protein PSTG_07453 [Puccinia striiformis f. sp. tritici PST-78]